MEMGKCCSPVWDDASHHSYPCNRKAIWKRNGKWYCGIHDPVSVRMRAEKREAALKIKHAGRDRRWALEEAAPALLTACKAALAAAELDVVLGPENIKMLRKVIKEAEAVK